ncbi:MAG TPA: Dabb family protein [Mariniphaga sp.]|nr:Dabb family protein [Mariniphaga sp.]
MINHIVLFKLKDYPEDKKVQILNELKESLEGLQEKITEVKFIEVGINHQINSDNFDLSLITYFETLDDLEAYRVHPEHQKVVERIRETTVDRASVDYFFE